MKKIRKPIQAKRRNLKKFLHELTRKSHRSSKRRKMSFLQGRKLFVKSKTLDFVISKISAQKKKKINKKMVIYVNVPDHFCFFSNPNETLEFLRDLALSFRKENYRKLMINHSRCEEIDLGASLVMDVLMMEALQEWKINKLKRTFEGVFPENAHMKDILCGTGLIKNLGLSKKYPIVKERIDKFKYFPLTIGKRNDVVSATESPQKDKATESIVNYFNTCFNVIDKKLTLQGRNYVTRMIGEVLDNVEQHNPGHHWYISSYLDQTLADDIAECRVAIVNFGKSIYETMNEDPSEELRERVGRLLKIHTAKKLLSKTWDEEQLWTLYALQQGVSRFSGKIGGEDRGTGTVNMINFFQSLCGSSDEKLEPQMTLISGNTMIKFDKKYKMKEESIDGELFKVIAFNETNSLESEPNKDNVIKLKKYFPGTILSMKFYFDKKYIVG